MEEECHLCSRVGTVQFLSQDKVWNVLCVVWWVRIWLVTKDHEHKRHQTGKVSASIVIAETAQVHRDQQAFFSNEKNKTNFISLLTTHLRGTGHQVEVSCGDADTLIVSSALEFAWDGQTVVAEDTDVLIMLVYHWRNCMEDIFIRKESRLSTPGEMISMTDATSSIPVVIQRHILLIHAWSGCDTTSATFGHGKMYITNILNRVPEVQNLSTIVSDRDALADEVGYAGLRLFCLLYGGTKTDTLTSLRYARYMTMMAKSNKVVLQWLPPTERAAHYHSVRVHFQVVRWTVLSNDMLQANGDGKWLTIPFAPWWPTWMLHPQRFYSSFDVCANQQARTLVERNNAPVTKMDWDSWWLAMSAVDNHATTRTWPCT